MVYFLYFLAFILLSYGLLCLVFGEKEGRIFNFLFFLFPYRIWAIFLLILSGLFWQAGPMVNYGLIAILFSGIFCFGGMAMLFLPEKRIRKEVQKWEFLPTGKKRIRGIFFLLLALILYFSV